MGVFSCYCAFGSHAGMRDCMGAGKLFESESTGDIPWMPFFLVNFDRSADAHHPEVGPVSGYPLFDFSDCQSAGQDRMAGMGLQVECNIE